MEGNKNYLDDLFSELGITNTLSKTVVAALVLGTLESNNCGLNGDNIDQVQAVIKVSCPDEYLYDIACVAGAWDNDLLDILCKYEPSLEARTFYSEHVWPYLQSHEVIPGVIMQK